jgi:hypothetical protein
MKFIIRLTKHFIIFLLALIVQLIGMVVLLFVLPFLSRNGTKLPHILSWFDNAENIYLSEKDMHRDGLSGPAYYRASDLGRLETYGPYDGEDLNANHELVSKYELFKSRYDWLALRNPINYFQYDILGAHIDIDDVVITKGDETNNYSEVETEACTYYEYYIAKPWLFGFIFRFRMGWKITSTYRPIQQWVFTLNPFARQI